MSNQKTIIPTRNGQSTEKTDSATVAENVEVVETQTTGTLQIIGRKTPNDVFEKLEQGNKLRENFHRFKEKFDVCGEFKTNYNNEALLMTIQNLGTGAEIKIQSIPMILEFVEDKVIKAGKNHLEHLEDEILNFAI